MILVAGGSGFVGSAVVRRLVSAGQDVAVMTAHSDRSGPRIQELGARPVEGDVQDLPSLAGAVRGADVVIQALTFPTFPVEKRSKGYTFEQFDHIGTRALVQSAAEAGVARFVFVSGAGAAPDADKVWFRAKWAGEEAIRATGIDHVIIRPSWVYGPDDRALNRFVALHRWLPIVPVVGDGSRRLQPMFIDDLAEVLTRAADRSGPAGTYEAGGPDIVTMNDVLRTMMDIRGKRRPLAHVPILLPKLGGFLVQWLPKPPLSPDAVDFLTGDAVADVGPLVADFGIRLTPLREGLATYL